PQLRAVELPPEHAAALERETQERHPRRQEGPAREGEDDTRRVRGQGLGDWPRCLGEGLAGTAPPPGRSGREVRPLARVRRVQLLCLPRRPRPALANSRGAQEPPGRLAALRSLVQNPAAGRTGPGL